MQEEHKHGQNGSQRTADPKGQVERLVMCFNSGENLLKEKPATLEEWKLKAEELWKLLDDIDTAGDMFKPEINGYFKYVQKKVEQRFKQMESDGYKIINTGT